VSPTPGAIRIEEREIDALPPHGPGVWVAQPAQERFLMSSVREALYGGEAGGGKRLDLRTPIPTPFGWTTMGEIRVGDVVLAADGQPTRVSWISDIEPNPTAFVLVFDDGTELTCDAEHQWVTLSHAERAAMLRLDDSWRARRRASRAARRGGKKSERFSSAIAARNAARAERLRDALKPPPSPRGSTRTTQEIVDTLHVGKNRRANHCIVNPEPLDLPPADLLVDPYTLGAWLGDGKTRGGGLYGLDPEVWQAVESAGFTVTHAATPVTHYIRGLVPLLRRLGVFGNKHVPPAYLRASLVQRLALLQGLCDTDGHATEKGSIEFTTTRRELCDGMLELLATLGIKPSCREGRATLRGRDIGPKWRIQFWTELPCFRIRRKLARQKRDGFRGLHDRRYIVEARPVEPVPMRCIAVDAPSRTYLAGRQMVVTHNTDALLIDALCHVDSPHHRALVMRRAFVDLQEWVLPRSYDLYPALGGKYHRGVKTWIFPSGARIRLGSADNEQSIRRFAGAPYNYIGWDELTHFTEWQYRFMYSRLRSAFGLPLYMRSATNPGGVGHEWVLARWAPWLYPPGTEDEYQGQRAAPGEVLWYRPLPGQEGEKIVPPFTPRATSRTFYPAGVADNVFLAGTEYEENLDLLPLLDREHLKHGNWLARPGAGMFFRREWWGVPVKASPSGVVVRLRFWDLAATAEDEAVPGGAWTAGVLLAAVIVGTGQGGRPIIEAYVEDVVRGQWSPGSVLAAIKQTAVLDHQRDARTHTFIERDPAQAGKYQAWSIINEMAAEGIAVKPIQPQGDKILRAKIPSAKVEQRTVKIVAGMWNRLFIDEAQGFPEHPVKDQVDAFTGGYRQLELLAASAATAARGRGIIPRAPALGGGGY
jgi:predicted phage terminase large subunit-like protein